MFLSFIDTNTTGILQTFGKFSGTKAPGLRFYIPIMQTMSIVSNKLEQLGFNFEVKTKDDVFLNLGLKVQYQVMPEDSSKAFFLLSSPENQMDAFIENAVRSIVPQMTMNQVFESQNDICGQVNDRLATKMANYGFTIRDTLVTSIQPPKEVQDAMNHIKASERRREASKNEADANYILEVRNAEADRDRKILQGEGISGQRLAILKGYERGVDDMAIKFGLTPRDIIAFVMETQKLDTMESIGKSSNTKTLFFDTSVDSHTRNIIRAREV